MSELFHNPRPGLLAFGLIGAVNVYLGWISIENIYSDGIVTPYEADSLKVNFLNLGLGGALVGLCIGGHLKPQE